MDCLELTLYPSLTLSLVGKRGGSYVKIFGAKKGARVEDDAELSGRWYKPWNYSGEVDRIVEDIAYDALEKYVDCLSLSISRDDFDLLFVVAFLTQNTSYHVNVLRWTRKLFSITEELSALAKYADRVGRSYQLRNLPKAVEEYLSRKPKDRRELISIRGVGPKVADLLLLFTGDSTSAPIDRHMLKFLKNFELSTPRKELCRKYHCDYCPISNKCARAFMYARFGKLAGWIQTVAYVEGAGKRLPTLFYLLPGPIE